MENSSDNATSTTENFQQNQAAVNTPPRTPRQRRVSPLLLIVVILLAAIFGLWFWQQNKITGLNKRLSTVEQQSAAKDQALKESVNQTKETVKNQPTATAPATTNAAISDNLLTGTSEITSERVTIDALYKYKETLKAVWIEYGETSTNLNKSTFKATKSLGEGIPETGFMHQDFPIAIADLKTGTRYYFRAVGQYGEQVEKSGISSFTTTK